MIGGFLYLFYREEKDLNCWVKTLYNTNLDALEWHYANHKYKLIFNEKLENYVMNELEEIIKLKRLKKDLNV